MCACGAAVTAGAVCGAASLLRWNNKSIVTTEYEIGSPRVPEAFDGFRIVQVSDLQSEYFGLSQSSLLRAVRNGDPDIIVITGDLIDRNHTDYMAAYQAVSGLVRIAPVYYVNGNHEYVLPDRKLLPFFGKMRDLGVHMMLDEGEEIRRGDSHINIAGLSENSVFAAKEAGQELGVTFEYTELIQRMKEVLEKTDGEYSILLTHEPQYLEQYARLEPDLIFCGHAHGGQFRLPGGQGLFAPGQGPLPKLTSGVHQMGRTQMVISRGLGNSIFPWRLNNRPEIVAAVLRSSEDED